jgi:hypothetical protein
VHKIIQIKEECETSGIQQVDALETLLMFLIEKFGPLTSPKLFELVSCFGAHGVVNPSSSIEKVISLSLQNLMLEKHAILYSAEFGNWKINDEKAENQWVEVGLNKALPRFSLRNFKYSEQALNIKGLGNEYVYVVYQSEARIESVLRNRLNWLLKVGRTNNLQRRVAQLSESGPNSLVIGIAFKTYDSRGLENYIHKALQGQKKACDIPGRREWFHSNMDEISCLRAQFERNSSPVA